MSANVTKEESAKSFFVFAKDTVTGKIKRMAIPADVQIGMLDNPAELQLLGRFSIANVEYASSVKNNGIFNTTNNDTIIGIRRVTQPPGNRFTVYLPSTPRDGQLHFVKDVTGTSSDVAIDVYAADLSFIDGLAYQTISIAYGSMSFYWYKGSWKVLTSISSGGGGGGAPINATYITMVGEGSLTAERHLGTSSNITVTDAGPNSTVTFDLSTLLGSPGTFTYPTITADSKGRITAISNGTQPAAPSASYITVTSEPGLTNERALTSGYGISITDNGANSTIVVSSTFLGGDAWIDGGSKIRTTSSVAISAGTSFADVAGTESFFYVSGTQGIVGSAAKKAIFGGDARVSGTLSVGSGSGVTITSNDVQFSAFSSRIDRSGNDLRFFDVNNPFGWTLAQLAQSGSSASFTPFDNNASYVVLSLTSSLNNERVLSAGTQISIIDGGSNGNVTINSLAADASASYVVIGTTSSLPNERALSAGTQISIVDNGPNNNVTINSLAADASASYVVIGLTSSLANERILTAGTGITLVDNGPNNTIVITANGSVAGSTPLFSLPILAGTVTTNYSLSGSKQSLGALYFNPTIINKFSGSRKYWYRAIVDTSETPVSAAVDLYDINGIIAFPPGIVQNSIMSSSNQTMTQLQVDLTSQFNAVTGSGIIEARLWKTISGSITSSVNCRNARLEIEYT